jgi:phosphoribosylamine--glycine ligase
MEAVIEKRLDKATLQWLPHTSVCVVTSSGGYPGPYQKGKVITGLDAAENLPKTTVFHAGTKANGGNILTAGGRVLGVTALGTTIQEAIQRAYEGVAAISFEGMHYRKDIGQKALKYLI